MTVISCVGTAGYDGVSSYGNAKEIGACLVSDNPTAASVSGHKHTHTHTHHRTNIIRGLNTHTDR